MIKSILFSLAIILLSVFVVQATDNTLHFYPQSDFSSTEQTATFHQTTIHLPASLANTSSQHRVLGDNTEDKTIYVDLTDQRLYAYEGDRLIYSFLVSTGKWGKTPTGTFQIANKFRYVTMSGGSKVLRTSYHLPNVPFTMFFGNDQIPASRGFSIHGTYWHDNFGHPMSHGCVNMKTSEAEIMYNWANPVLPSDRKSIISTTNNPGTTIIIYGVAPNS